MRSLYKILKYFAEIYQKTTHEQVRIFYLLLIFLLIFFQLKQENIVFEYFGIILGSIISRAADSVTSIRILTVDCIEYILKIFQIFTETIIFDQSEKQFEKFDIYKQKLIKTDTNLHFSVVNDFSKVKF